MSNKSDGTLGLILHYQKKLDKYSQTGEHEKIMYCIHKLKYLPVTVNHLEVTGVGKSINSLRHMQGEVGEKAKALVQKWKQMVSAEEQEEQQQELQSQCHSNDKRVNEEPTHEDYDEGDDSDENSRLHIEEKNYNVTENNYEADEDNCNGYDPKTSRQDYQSIGVNSENLPSYNPVDLSDSNYCSNQNNNASCQALNSDNITCREEKHKHEDKHVKKKHHKSKSHHSSSSNSKGHKSRKDKDVSPIINELDFKDRKIKSKDKDRHRHKHKSNISHSDLEKSLDSSSHSSPSKLKETSYSKASLLDLNKNIDSHQSTSTNLLSNKVENENKLNESHCLNENNHCINKFSKEFYNKSDSSSSSSKRSHSKSNEKSKRKKESEVESSGFELALKDMDLPTQKKKKKKSQERDEENSENKHGGKSSFGKQPTLLNVDYGKNLPALPSFDDEPMSSQLNVHYKPLPQIPQRSIANDPFHSRMTDEEALNIMLSSRNTSRTRKIYTGKASGLSYVPTLYECCIKVLQENFDALRVTGDIPYVPYDILKPVLERTTPQQLFVLEDYYPYLLDDSDELWAMQCRKSFKNKEKEEMENWRDMFIRCTDEQTHRMKVITESLAKKYESKVPARRTTQLAFAKPPRNIARAQAKYGTWSSSSSSPQKPSSSYKSEEGGTQPLQRNVANNSRPDRPLPQYKPPTAKKPKVAPLMAKTRQLMKKVCRR